MKLLIFATGDGDCTCCYSETVNLVIEVEDNVDAQSLHVKYRLWATENRVLAPGRKKKTIPTLDFYQWLQQVEGYQPKNFEYWCPWLMGE